jgi:tRNA(Ile)-lysidine synthase
MLPFTLPDSHSYAVAFSGGADSRLLLELTLRALLERYGEEGRHRVIALHLHHGIRGEEADRDLAFCEEVCTELGIQLISERVNIPAMAEELGESMETVARKARYGFFGRVMDERRIGILLTAHHADDNLETVLAQLIRGSGTRGMRGIPITRMLGYWTDKQVKLVHRPLLDFTKRDILAACEELSLDFVTDSTNLENHCTRNRIRHAVIPELEAIAGKDAPQRAAARMARAAEEDEDYLWYHAEQSVGRTVAPDGEAVALSDLEHFSPSLSKRMLMVLYRDVLRLRDRGAETELFLSSIQLQALLELGRKAIPESGLDLPGGIRAVVRGEFLYMLPTEEVNPPLLSDEPVLLTEGTTLLTSGFSVSVEYSDTLLSPAEGYDIYASAVFPADLPAPLLARKRKEGDIILSHGMHKKLKKILNEKKIPAHLRDRVPLICLPQGEPNGEPDGSPLWYPRAAYRDGYPAPEVGPCLRITVRFPQTRHSL